MEGHKAMAGMIAAFALLGSGLCLYLSADPASLLSSSALAYLVVGMIAAALVFGIAIDWLNCGVAAVLERFVTTPMSSVVADFKDGVLTVTLPKTAGTQKREKKIAINAH